MAGKEARFTMEVPGLAGLMALDVEFRHGSETIAIMGLFGANIPREREWVKLGGRTWVVGKVTWDLEDQRQAGVDVSVQLTNSYAPRMDSD